MIEYLCRIPKEIFGDAEWILQGLYLFLVQKPVSITGYLITNMKPSNDTYVACLSQIFCDIICSRAWQAVLMSYLKKFIFIYCQILYLILGQATVVHSKSPRFLHFMFLPFTIFWLKRQYNCLHLELFSPNRSREGTAEINCVCVSVCPALLKRLYLRN